MTVVITLTYDSEKALRDGKRRYSDEDGHNLYLQGEEVQALGGPSVIKLVITSA